MLVDRQIAEAIASGDLRIEPDAGVQARIQPASLDVRLGREFGIYMRDRLPVIDPKVDSTSAMDWLKVEADDCFVLHPGEFVLAATLESIALADTLLARVEGKSSLGRFGLLVHCTAGFVDPGWELASITLELANVNVVPIKLWPGMPIAQLALERVAPVASGYSGKYVRQQGPTPSRYHQNWTGSAWA